MKFYAHCSEHSCNLVLRTHLEPDVQVIGIDWRPEGNYYEIGLDSFECHVAKSMGQDGVYVNVVARSEYICRGDWVLEPIDDTVVLTKKPDQVLVDRSALQEIIDQLRGLAFRLGQLIGIHIKTKETP